MRYASDPLQNLNYIDQLRRAVERGEPEETAKTLERIWRTPHLDQLFNARFLMAQADALVGRDLEAASKLFRQGDFLGEGGHMLLVAPYTQRRDGRTFTKLSMLLAVKTRLNDIPDPREKINEAFGYIPDHIPTVTSIEVLEGVGLTGTPEGEAFITPDGWGFEDPEDGPALLDMPEQQRRFGEAGAKCIESIFEPESAARILELINDSVRGLQARHYEYQGHDIGHSLGIGLKAKLRQNGLQVPANRGREEFRADGISFLLAQELLPRRDVADLILSNIATRFGIDAHRAGGLETDVDVISSCFSYQWFRMSELLQPTDRGLRIMDLSDRGIVQMVQPMAQHAAILTRRERQLARPDGIAQLYATLDVAESLSREFVQQVVSPGRSQYAVLR